MRKEVHQYILGKLLAFEISAWRVPICRGNNFSFGSMVLAVRRVEGKTSKAFGTGRLLDEISKLKGGQSLGPFPLLAEDMDGQRGTCLNLHTISTR